MNKCLGFLKRATESSKVRDADLALKTRVHCSIAASVVAALGMTALQFLHIRGKVGDNNLRMQPGVALEYLRDRGTSLEAHQQVHQDTYTVRCKQVLRRKVEKLATRAHLEVIPLQFESQSTMLVAIRLYSGFLSEEPPLF